ncbi:hypothetical protein BBJ29_007779 [Phytophthora kernoviae]|uniref:Uncharacterized protein n=1 Tax=Phytophthora kernoviae TaxID=325452 RepID=A0A3F2REF7_9STRA|nr:hypothetical protein BBP00_00008793 [Phytophthora kernoviae]RLN65104.1 hypothetical protein BBJ29_007779 [Phytophthora kernoviae]
MARRRVKVELPNSDLPVEDVGDGGVEDFMRQEEAYRKQFEPVAPWKRDNIPDYGPLQDHHHVVIFGIVAYMAIWFPLWFRLLGRVSPAPTEEEQDARERRAFERDLQKIVDEEDEVDD